MYASDMQPGRQLCIERRTTLPLSLYSAFPTKRRKRREIPFHQAIPIYLTAHQPSSHHPTTNSSMTLPSERPTPSQDHHHHPVHQKVTHHTNEEPPTVLEPYALPKAQPHGSRKQNTPTMGVMHVIQTPQRHRSRVAFPKAWNRPPKPPTQPYSTGTPNHESVPPRGKVLLP